MQKVIFGFLLCLAGPVLGADAPSTKVICHKTSNGSYNLLSGVALSAAAASRTLDVPLSKNWGKLRVLVFHDFANSGTVSMTLTESMDEGGTFAAPSTKSCTSGICTTFDMVDQYTPAADILRMFEYDVKGLSNFRIVFSEPSDDSDDTITVQACMVSGD